jgi:hypothetical protein
MSSEQEMRIKELESENEVLRRAISPYVVSCRKCGTEAGDRCRYPDGRMASTHTERIVDAFHAVPGRPEPSPAPAWIESCGEPWGADRRVLCQQDTGHYPGTYHRASVNANQSVAWS